nr:hypothetical protein [Tanacetum cinerariifolium]
VSWTRSFAILIKHPTCLNDPLRIALSVKNPIDGHYCQGCALLRKKFKEDLFTYGIKNGIHQDAFDPSNDNTNIVNAHQEPFVIKQDPGKNSSQSTSQINHHCCYGCGEPLDDIFCHQCTCELCGKGAHYGYNYPSKFLIIPNPEPFNNQTIDELPQTLPSFDPTCYSKDGNSFTYDSKSNLVDDSPNETILEIELAFEDKHCKPEDILELFRRLHNDVQNIHEELAVYINTLSWDCLTICYNDDDDEDCTIAITPKEPDNSLSMGDEHLDTISAIESDEFIKSSVENHVPNLSESEGEHECDVPAYEDFTTFSNLLFDVDDDFSSNPHHFNDESDLIESLLNNDSSIISSSSKIDSLFDEFARELTLLKSFPPGINEIDCDPEEETRLIKRLLYDNSSPRLLEEFVSENSDAAIKSFSPFPIPVEDSDSFMEEIDLSFTPDDPMSSGIEEDDYDSKRDIVIFEELLSNDSLSLLENETFHFDILSSPRPPAKPLNGNSGTLNVKVMGDISEHKVLMPRLMLIQPILVSNQEKSPNLLFHLGHKASHPSTEFSMMIYGRNIPILDVPFLHFYPLDKLNIPRNLKTHAKGFCPSVFISSASLGNHVKDIKEKDKIGAETEQNQEQMESVKKSKVKPDREDDYDSERYILILEEFLSNDSLSLPENKSFHFDILSSSRPPAKPPDGNLGILSVKVMGDIYELNVPMPRLMLNYPTLVPNQEKSPNLLSHQGHEAFQPSTECPMMIYGRNTPILDVIFFHFYPP